MIMVLRTDGGTAHEFHLNAYSMGPYEVSISIKDPDHTRIFVLTAIEAKALATGLLESAKLAEKKRR